MSTRWPMRMAGRSSTRGSTRSRAAPRGRRRWPVRWRGRPVARVLVTHHHPDHVGLAGWFQVAGRGTADDAHRVAVRADADAPTFRRQRRLSRSRSGSSAGMAPEILEARRTERPFNFADVVAPMPLGFTRIEEGQRLRLGGRDWIVRFGHGHAPDHATLWSEDGEIVLGGDQLLPSISPNLGVLRHRTRRRSGGRMDRGLPQAAALCNRGAAGSARPQAALHRFARTACGR